MHTLQTLILVVLLSLLSPISSQTPDPANPLPEDPVNPTPDPVDPEQPVESPQSVPEEATTGSDPVEPTPDPVQPTPEDPVNPTPEPVDPEQPVESPQSVPEEATTGSDPSVEPEPETPGSTEVGPEQSELSPQPQLYFPQPVEPGETPQEAPEEVPPSPQTPPPTHIPPPRIPNGYSATLVYVQSGYPNTSGEVHFQGTHETFNKNSYFLDNESGSVFITSCSGPVSVVSVNPDGTCDSYCYESKDCLYPGSCNGICENTYDMFYFLHLTNGLGPATCGEFKESNVLYQFTQFPHQYSYCFDGLTPIYYSFKYTLEEPIPGIDDTEMFIYIENWIAEEQSHEDYFQPPPICNCVK